jgi:hypothetical protein
LRTERGDETGGEEMTEHRTYRQIAESWELWQEYVDPQHVDTREHWDGMTTEERIGVLVACFGEESAGAVLVQRSDSGTYQIIGEPESWDEVCRPDVTMQQERAESLLGWGEYRSAWRVRVTDDAPWQWYFVTK